MTDSDRSIARTVLVVIASVVVCLLCASLALARRDAVVYPSNIWVGGVAIGGLNQQEVLVALTEKTEAIHDINLRLPDKNLAIPLQELGIQYDCRAALASVDKSLYDGKGLFSIFRHAIIRGNRQVIVPVFRWDDQTLKAKLREIKTQNDRPARDARILYSDSYIEYISHSNGYSINIEQSGRRIMQSLQKGNLNGLSVSVSETRPRVKLDDIQEIKEVIGLSVTPLPGNPRQYAPALQSINGLIVMPGGSIDLKNQGDDILYGPLGEGLRTACSRAGLQDKGAVIYNSLNHPILITCAVDENILTIRIFNCRG